MQFHGAHFLSLYGQELKALGRARFLLWGAAGIAAFLAFIAAVPATDGVIRDFIVTSAFILPQIVGVLAAATFANDRTNGFLDSMLTTPVRATTFFLSRLTALLTATTIVLAAWIPYGLVIAHFLGLPPYFADLTVYALGMALWSVLLGTFIGVAFANRGPAAAVGVTAAIIVIAALATLPVHNIDLQQPLTPTHEFMLFLAHLSPHVLLFEALGLSMSEVLGNNPELAATAFFFETALLFMLAHQLYNRHHLPARWQHSRTIRWTGVLAAAALLVAVPIVSGAEYGPAPDNSQERRNSSIQFSHTIAGVFLLPGETLPKDAFHPFYPPTDGTPLDYGIPTARDLVVMLPLPFDSKAQDLRIDVKPAPGMTIVGVPHSRMSATATDRGTIPNDRAIEGVPADDPVFAFRIRVMITLNEPEAFSSDWYFSELHITYTFNGEDFSGSTALPVSGHVPGAAFIMAGAGLPSVLLPAGTAFVRARRTRGA